MTAIRSSGQPTDAGADAVVRLRRVVDGALEERADVGIGRHGQRVGDGERAPPP